MLVALLSMVNVAITISTDNITIIIIISFTIIMNTITASFQTKSL